MATFADGALDKLSLRDTMDPKLRGKWECEQDRLKEMLILKDTEDWQKELLANSHPPGLKHIAGMDLSFIKGDDTRACLGLVVVSYPELQVVYEDCHMIELHEPYIPGFLAFREAPPMIEAFNNLKRERPDLTPQVLMVDGNGILHNRGFGLGCHLGVTLDVPALGVAKQLFHVDGLENSPEHKTKITGLHSAGDWFPLIGDSTATHGAAVRATNESTNPVYVSVGHRISLEVAVKLVTCCSVKRVAEPTRQADLRSREFLRKLLEPPKQTKKKSS